MKYNTDRMHLCRILKAALLLLAILQVNLTEAQSSKLDKEITITFKNDNLETVLSKIENSTGLSFSYAPDAIKKDIVINKSFNKIPLGDLLDEVLARYKIHYRETGNTILIQTQGTKGKVMGQVSDDKGAFVPFASVILKGTTYGASSDENGLYNFYAPEGNYTLMVSSLGFKKMEKTVTVTASKSTRVDLVLQTTVEGLDEIIITESRIPESISEVPSTVIVISDKEIIEQVAISDNLPDILALKIPGLTPSEETQNAFVTKLRGRDALMLIDGIPQTSPLRDGSRDLRTISANVLERVEVVNGATATYGNGATGGVINYITKQPLLENGKKFSVDINTSFNPAHPDETLGYSINPFFLAKVDNFDITLAAKYKETGVVRSSNGEVVAPFYGLGETKSTNIFGKVGYSISEKHRLEFMANSYYSRQDSKYITENGVYGENPAIGVLGYTDGKEDSDNDGEFESRLYNALVPPLKLMGTLEYQFTDNWKGMFQVLHVGSRDVFSVEDLGTYGKNPITGYTLADVFTSYKVNDLTFRLGIDNLFNVDYFPLNSEVRGSGPYYQKGSGINMKLGVTLSL